MKKINTTESLKKDIELMEEMMNCEYFDFRIEALAQKIKLQNYKPKRISNF